MAVEAASLAIIDAFNIIGIDCWPMHACRVGGAVIAGKSGYAIDKRSAGRD